MKRIKANCPASSSQSEAVCHEMVCVYAERWDSTKAYSDENLCILSVRAGQQCFNFNFDYDS